jgi:hypothetical protein
MFRHSHFSRSDASRARTLASDLHFSFSAFIHPTLILQNIPLPVTRQMAKKCFSPFFFVVSSGFYSWTSRQESQNLGQMQLLFHFLLRPFFCSFEGKLKFVQLSSLGCRWTRDGWSGAVSKCMSRSSSFTAHIILKLKVKNYAMFIPPSPWERDDRESTIVSFLLRSRATVKTCSCLISLFLR